MSSPTTIQRMTHAATMTGEDHIETVSFDLSAVRDHGVFIAVNCLGFSSLGRRLTWNDLGVEVPKGDVKFRPPNVGLLPAKYERKLLRAREKAYLLRDRYTMRFTAVAALTGTDHYWMPYTAWDAFNTEFAEIQAELESAIADVENNYESIVKSVTWDFRTFLEQSARRLAVTGNVPSPNFVEDAMNRIISLIPTPDDLRRRLRIDRRVVVVELTSDILAERAAIAAAQADMENLAAEQRIKAEMRTAELETYKSVVLEAVAPLREAALHVRAQMYDAAKSVLESIKKNGMMHGSTADAIHAMGDTFAAWNFQGDEKLEELINRLKNVMTTKGDSYNGKYNVLPIEAVLEDIVSLTYKSTIETAAPNRFTALEF